MSPLLVQSISTLHLASGEEVAAPQSRSDDKESNRFLDGFSRHKIVASLFRGGPLLRHENG